MLFTEQDLTTIEGLSALAKMTEKERFGSQVPDVVVVHPLVLLSVVDHYQRSATNTRVVGVLLGESHKGRVDVTNSYAVPFEQDSRDPKVWFFDYMYHEEMFHMFKKVNAKEEVIGWYHTGPKLKPSDLDINELMKKYCKDPVLVVIDANPTDDLTIPTEAYVSVQNIAEEKDTNRISFQHVPSEIGAFEVEEIGVEHLLRDITDSSATSLGNQINAKITSLKQLANRFEEIFVYLDRVYKEELPINHQIIYHIQDVFNLSPNLHVEEIVKSFNVKTNDMMLIVYVSSLIRSVIAMHNLINNKNKNRQDEKEANGTAEKERKEETDKKKEETKKEDEQEKK